MMAFREKIIYIAGLLVLITGWKLIGFRSLRHGHGSSVPLRNSQRSTLVMSPFDCVPYGWNYSISLAAYDRRASQWQADVVAARKKENRGKKLFTAHLCGYDVDKDLIHARQKETFIDVGANLGQSILPYASRGWEVFAFEPTAHNLQVLRANIARNSFTNVHVIPCGVSNRSGDAMLFIPGGREDNSALGGEKTADLNVKTGHVRKEKICLRTVDSELLSNPSFHVEKVRVIKIDTQGHEIEVLQGMKKLIRRLPSTAVIKLEFNDKLQKTAGHELGVEGLLSFIRSLGFDVFCKKKCVPKGKMAHCLDVVLKKAKKPGACN